MKVHPDGYINYYWPRHPLSNSAGIVSEHALVLWQASYYSDEVLLRIKDPRWTIHHINGQRDDNDSANLEWRLASQHPRGLGVSDAVRILEANGFECCPICHPVKGG
jgi:hypothetical protein